MVLRFVFLNYYYTIYNSLDIKFFFFFVGRAWRKRRAPGSAHALPRLLRYAAKRAVRIMPWGGSMLDETGFYAPSVAHNALPRRPWRCISVVLSIILQTLGSFAMRSHESTRRHSKPRPGTYAPYVVVKLSRVCTGLRPVLTLRACKM